MKTAVAIIGEFNSSLKSHAPTNEAIAHCSAALGASIEHRWVGSEEFVGLKGVGLLKEFAGVWMAPGIPYKKMEGALSAIRAAREQGIPLLGTCQGFQHVVLEYARHVLGFGDAQHEEITPDCSRPFISKLACSLVGRTMVITLQPDSLVARAYRRTKVQEQYRCSYGVNPEYVHTLTTGRLRVVGSDDEGVARVVELAGHPFFVGTLFVPQMTSTPAAPHPLILGFLSACLHRTAALPS